MKACAVDLKSGPPIDHQSHKTVLVNWLQQIQGLSPRTIKERIRYLDKFARPIGAPSDVLGMFDGLIDSQKRHLANGFRSFFRFYEARLGG